MADPDPRPERAPAQQGNATVIVYDFHIEIEVKAAPLDEKRLQQLLDERFDCMAATLRSKAR